MSCVRIVNKGASTRVFIDDNELKNVTYLSFTHAEVGELPTFNIKIIPTTLTLDTTWLPELPSPWRDFYTKRETTPEAMRESDD